MSAELFRKYIEIVEGREAERINEGLMDSIKSLVPKAMKLLGGQTISDIANKVKQVTGGDYTPSGENAIKVAKAFGFDKMVSGNNADAVAEGLAGNWQGRLLQMLHLLGVGAGAAQAVGLTGLNGMGVGQILSSIGILLLLVTATFWSSEDGMVGAMGRDGRKGWQTRLDGDD
jgi:hypothetical protein